ncbi:MAG: cardiolipin synthase [Puniceicoccaceae bacterium]|nr:MAG: cardiolipin synthase [Puniceicoccaceae bacterium]
MERFPVLEGLFPHLGTIFGFGLAFVLIARLMKEKRQPGNTFAWMLVIVLIPYLGVPLYLLLGGRKLRRLAAEKGRFSSALEIRPSSAPTRDPPPLHVQYGTSLLPPSAGNRVRFLGDGVTAYQVLMDSINRARHSIDFMTFILGRDQVGKALVQALARRAAEGIKVRVLIDALGSLKTRGHFLDPIRSAGGRIERFMPVLPIQSRWSANLRNHRKIILFDGASGMVGGHNIALEYMGPTPLPTRWRDFGAHITGPAARDLAAIFEADWAFASGHASPGEVELPPAPPADEDPLATSGASEVQIMASGPDVPGDPLYEAILSMIQEADHTVTLVTPYFIPDEVLLRTLMVKARSGRNVTLIVPNRSNHPITDFARSHFLRELLQAGAQVLHYMPGMVHGKVILVDNRIAMTGSANLDLRSLFVNYEVGVFFFTPQDVLEVERWIKDLVSASRPFFKVRPEKPGFFTGLGEDVCRLLAPLL